MTVEHIGDGNPDGTILTAVAIRGLPMGTQATPQTATATATLTAAQMVNGILVATPTAAATYTTATGTLIEAALSGEIATGDTFDLPIINLGGTGDVITMAGGTGVTFVGDLAVAPEADVATIGFSSGIFRFRRSAANTFVGYRIS